VHSELCACYHNVENGQKGKQDAYIIFWKFPKSTANAIKMHLAYDLGKMIPVQFLAREGNYSEKKFSDYNGFGGGAPFFLLNGMRTITSLTIENM